MTLTPLMAREAAETPDAIRRQIDRCTPLFQDLGDRLRRLAPRFVVTGARGSSDHAATYGKYLIETRLGLPVASIGPSVVSLYQTPLQLKDSLYVTVSQSGRSPDLLRLTEAAKAGGALTVAFVNDETSPLFQLVDVAIPLCAGPEKSVAATKSYLTSLFAFLQMVAYWKADPLLVSTLAQAPEWMERAVALDWYPGLSHLTAARGLYIIGRGLGAAAAQEMALKCKETSRLQADAFSAAEVIHGPLALVGPDFPVLALTQDDVTLPPTIAAIRRMVAMGGTVLSTATDVPGVVPLPTVPGVPVELAPLAATLSFYMGIHRVATDRGLNPDVPPNLAKVTETV
ncbi:SIS domain-containing protein [Nitrospirillum iridis]|uniref:Glucosamine--fructose-6-phosphate aminotransferase (Isomerizing) n=1 Tax=Nitrospirillum iridis TaxID=765888 RepID=A0A7X0AZ04_9PROT|nr:SIS domain-containing protein [Nitrospirillum iridis]MBB6251154.1 glucosamine--fructose-6-phosphate aminotransferase (isomerizing) [Nitrospirillum iridis]